MHVRNSVADEVIRRGVVELAQCLFVGKSRLLGK